MIISTPPASIKAQHSGDELPDYATPAAFEQARLASEREYDCGQQWQEDLKDPSGLRWDAEQQRGPAGEAELEAAPPARAASFDRSSRTSGGDLSDTASALLQLLLEHALHPPRFSARVRGRTAGPSPRSFDFVLDASEELEAGTEGGRRAVLFAAEEGAETRRSASCDLECGGASCLGALRGATDGGMDKERGLPGFVHPSSLADIGSPSASLLHPPQLHQGLFADVAEVHSTGLEPAADYPQYCDITRQHKERVRRVRQTFEKHCSSTNPLKKLLVEKEVYGWDLRRIRAGLQSTIEATADVSSLDITFSTDDASLIIRSSTFITQLLDLPVWSKALLYLTVIYPFFLLICHVVTPAPTVLYLAFPLTSWRLLPPTSDDETAEELASTLVKRRPTKVARLPPASGELGDWVVLVGTTEGEWIEKCGARIREELRRRGLEGVAAGEK